MKLLLLILFSITLVGAKPNKPERTEDSECKDTLTEEACQIIALKRGCIEDPEAKDCRKTCKFCHACEDIDPNYCNDEIAKELLDCNRGDHQDLCEKTCGMCTEGAASRKVKRSATDELRTHQTDERAVLHKRNKAGTRRLKHKRDADDCTDDEDAAFCSDMLAKNICSDPNHKAKAGKCAKTCGLCFECKDYSNLCETDGIDVCGQEYIEHYCLKSCNKCNQRSLARAFKIKAKNAVSDPEARDPLEHLLRNKKENKCEDISTLCDTGSIDVCNSNKTIHFCLKTCNHCNAHSIARSLKIKARMAKGDRKAVDPLAHLMRQNTDLSVSPQCEDISSICPHNKETDICEREEYVHYCLKTCGRCSTGSMERALEMFAKLAGDHPMDKEDPLTFLLRKHNKRDLPETCADTSNYCDHFLNDAEFATIDICGVEEYLPYCRKSCNNCNERSILPKPSKTAEDPLMHLVRLETCVDKNLIHCMKVVNDNYCGKKTLAKECPKACGLCGQKKRSPDALLHLDGECKDDVAHCEEIKQQGLCESFETNHICKLTCGLCKK